MTHKRTETCSTLVDAINNALERRDDDDRMAALTVLMGLLASEIADIRNAALREETLARALRILPLTVADGVSCALQRAS